jgi:hypothetical protein
MSKLFDDLAALDKKTADRWKIGRATMTSMSCLQPMSIPQAMEISPAQPCLSAKFRG